MSQPTLGRQISAFEEDLGALLFDRIGRRLVLTDAGKAIADQLSPMAEAAELASLYAAGQAETIEGTLSITASDVFALYSLPPAIDLIHKVAPNLRLEIIVSNHLQDLRRREADIAIRHVRPQEPELIARLVCENTAGFYASQSYFMENGMPQSMKELAGHQFVGFGDDDRYIEYLKEHGIPLTATHCYTSSASGLMAWQLALNGYGIIPMSNAVAALHPTMQRINIDALTVHYPTWLVTHRELHTSKKIRLVFDSLAEALKTENPAPAL